MLCFLKLIQSEYNEMLRKSASSHVFTLVAFFFWVSYGHNVERQMLRLFEQINGGQQKIALNIQLSIQAYKSNGQKQKKVAGLFFFACFALAASTT